MLADVVSKNGNLLINVVQYPEGDLPPESRTFLREMAAWMKVNGEAIHGTRPWAVFGEGPTEPEEGAFKEGAQYTAKDIRFTAKGDVLYATALGQPRGELPIAALGRSEPHERRAVKSVHLLGRAAPLQFTQSDRALLIRVPAALPTKHASSFRIAFA